MNQRKIDPKKIGDRIKAAREANGFTQEGLAAKAGLAKNYLSVSALFDYSNSFNILEIP